MGAGEGVIGSERLRCKVSVTSSAPNGKCDHGYEAFGQNEIQSSFSVPLSPCGLNPV